ncbi:hypothetical protein J2Y57_003571 [Sphingomonas sp. BE137]|nr:hypothetical protein [Sphingomonas sp. BE137]
MADQIDIAAELNELHFDISLRAARRPVPVGVPGECEKCGDDSLRLVGGRCAPCRDGRRR